MKVAAEKGTRRSSRGKMPRIHISGVGGLLVLGGGLLAAALGIGVTARVFGKKKRHEGQSKEKGIEGGHPSTSHHQKPLSPQPSPSSSSDNSREMDDCVEAAPSAGHDDTPTEGKEQPPTLPHAPANTDNHTVLRAQDMDIDIDISERTGDVIAIDESKVTEENISTDDDVKEKQVADEEVYTEEESLEEDQDDHVQDKCVEERLLDEEVYTEEESLEEDQDDHVQDKCVEERLLAAIKDEDEGSPEEENRKSLSDKEIKQKVVDEDECKVEGLPKEKQSEHERMKLADEDKVKEDRSPEEEREQVSDSTENTSMESEEATDSSSSSSLKEDYGIMTAIKDDRNNAKNDTEPMQMKIAKEANAVTNYRINLRLALGLLFAIIVLLRFVETYQHLRGHSSL